MATRHRMQPRQADSWPDREAEAGSATVLALGVIGVLLSVLVAMAMLGAAVTARQQAQLAADLGAVAGAQSLRHGADADTVCGRVAQFVQDNAADLDQCTVGLPRADSRIPDVRVLTSRRVGLGPGWTARASARAGLVEP